MLQIAPWSLIAAIALAGTSAFADPIRLGSFAFDPNQFGDALIESDGGASATSHWLNTAEGAPRNPDYLLGSNFETGIANLGLWGAAPAFVVTYNTPIMNLEGADFGVVTARFSLNDSFRLSVSNDGGQTFSNPVLFGPAAAVTTTVSKSYYYGGSSRYDAILFVTPIDLTAFQFPIEHTINAVKIEPMVELDLIRIAGFSRVNEVLIPGAAPAVNPEAAVLDGSERSNPPSP